MKYKIVKRIALDFLTPWGQITVFVDNGEILVQDQKVFWINPLGESRETINWPWIIDAAYAAGDIEKIENNLNE